MEGSKLVTERQAAEPYSKAAGRSAVFVCCKPELGGVGTEGQTW
jgi:hypothetical protein